jgi:hypothetical protein
MKAGESWAWSGFDAVKVRNKRGSRVTNRYQVKYEIEMKEIPLKRESH